MLFVLRGTLFTDSLTDVSAVVLDRLTGSFGWAYLVVSLAMPAFLCCLAWSRYGRLRPGRDDDRPEFSRFGWYAMILSAVMGIGLIFYGVAEPIAHFVTPPPDLASPRTREAAMLAMQYSYLDWGLHAWAIFGVFGDKAGGPLGKTIDVPAIFSTLSAPRHL